MMRSLVEVLRDQIRGVTGALLAVGLTFHYTMETWWLGWTLPLSYLVGYALVGLAVVVLITRSVGFHEKAQTDREPPWWSVGVDFSQILLQSFLAAYATLLLLGIVDFTSPTNLVVRLGLVEVVPMGFGAALANDLFGDQDGESHEESEFPRNLGVFAIGALFVTSTIAPTQEMELVAVHMGWVHHAALVAATLAVVYLALYELEFKDQETRLQRDWQFQVGTVFLVYAVGVTTSFLLLLGFGHFIDATVALVYQETVVLAFPASVGAAAAEVLI